MSNEERIYNTATADGMPRYLALLLVAQSKHETGNYTHRFFTIGHNGFGYSYYPASRWQLSTGGPKADNGIPIAQYRSIEDSVHEITDWIKRRQRDGKFPADLNTITSAEQYGTLLKAANYFGAPLQLYINGIKHFFSTTWGKATGSIGMLLIIAGVFFC
jgi:hypothetical protein